MTVDLAALDRVLGSVRDGVSRLGANLLELDEERTRRRPQLDGLVGTSAETWTQASAQLDLLWEWFQAATTYAAKLEERRASARFRGDQVDALWSELWGAGLSLPDGTAEQGRQLLPEATGLADRVSVGQLLGIMTSAYGRIVDALASLTVAWDLALPQLASLEQDLRGFEGSATQAGLRVPNSVAANRTRIDALLSKAAHDPLSFDPAELAAARDAVGQVGSLVEEATAALAAVDGAVDNAVTALDQITESLVNARADSDETRAKIQEVPGQMDEIDAAVGQAARLSEETARIRGLLAADRATAERALRAVVPRIDQLRTEVTRLAKDAGAPLARRRELRGRLDAYRAKAQAVGRGEDLALDAAYRSARDVLYSAPCDLDDAEAKVTGYRRLLDGGDGTRP